MKKFLLISAAALLLSTSAPAGGAKIKIVATLFPQYDFARIVGGDKVSERLLLPPGVEPHSFEPTPQAMLDINRADVFIYTNRYMEPWVSSLLKGADKKLRVIEASKGVEVVKSDPHVWLDFGGAQIMVNNIYDALAAADPPNARVYLANAENLKKQLQQLDNKFRATLSACRTKLYIFGGHAAFNYLNRRYGLISLSPYRGFSPDTEPTAKNLIELIAKMRAHKLKYVYFEELLSPKLAETIARETGGQLLPLNGAHNVSRDDLNRGVTFISIMEKNLENLKVGLGWQKR